MSMHLIFASRPSALALYQTQWVIDALQALQPELICERRIITTQGDRILDKSLPEIGGKGLFTQELDSELLAGTVDCAVHSLKDLPIEMSNDLIIGCIPTRLDARDVMISANHYTLDSLPAKASVGTSSLRRAAQMLTIRPDLTVKSLRGNVDSRVKKALNDQYDAILLAGAGVSRLGMGECISQWLPTNVILPAPGQGALAVQCRKGDHSTLGILKQLDDLYTRRAVTAERQFLLNLGGGCSAPIAAFATITNTNPEKVYLHGRVLSLDGCKVIDVEGENIDAEQLGRDLAQRAMAQGALEILTTVGG